MPFVLAPPRQNAAPREQVRAFIEYLAGCGHRAVALSATRAVRPVTAVAALLMAGRTALLMLPSVPARDRADLVHLLGQRLLERLDRDPLHYVQALVEPGDHGRGDVLQRLGFRKLTSLLYLERDVRSAPVARQTTDVEWKTFDASTRQTFAETIRRTYEQSLDCPELTDLRPIDDVLAAHQAAGPFDPGLWQLAQVRGTSVGCVLLGGLPHRDTLELVYMGVVPEHRRGGLGARLLERAFQLARFRDVARMTVVVDERNAPARRLYEAIGLRSVARRTVYIRPGSPACA